ncbi:hypothetical protein JCM30237_17110 [Halolamina litorea]|uniref:PH domain-containing protein n=1 Tax=Halolamina litorea TaxID=1515593 RepID=A0ABD6BS73_9EURY|nr:hypothetical protein [Halolamina litorea]
MDTDPSFAEQQRFRQWWIWALLGGVALLMLLAGPVTWPGLAVLGAIALFIYSLRLRTEVRSDGVYYRLWPLHRSFRRIGWAEIETYEAETYRPIREFGGWGIRWAPGKIAYSVSGNRGVRIERAGEPTVLLGSQRPEAFAAAIEAASRP